MPDKYAEIGLNLEKTSDTKTVHENWLQRKLQEMTISSESRIKRETMGGENWQTFKSQLGFMIQTSLAGDVARGETSGTTVIPSLILLVDDIYQVKIAPYFERKRLKKLMEGNPGKHMAGSERVRDLYRLPPVKTKPNADR